MTGVQTCALPISSKLDVLGEQLRLLAEKPGLPQLIDCVQDDDNLFRSLDDLQEAILDYRVRSQPQPDAVFNINDDSRWRNRRQSATRSSDR